MIIWFTGQPNSGKTTLAIKLEGYLYHSCSKVIRIDGDDLRRLYQNNDYSPIGRRINIEKAQQLAKDLSFNYEYVIASFVSPFRDQRELFKKQNKVKEIYLYSSRLRDGKMVNYYEPPTENYLGLNTDLNIEDCVKNIIEFIKI